MKVLLNNIQLNGHTLGGFHPNIFYTSMATNTETLSDGNKAFHSIDYKF